MSLSKDELQMELRLKLEKLMREYRTVEFDKATSAKGFGDELKRIDNAITAVLEEIDSCQPALFDSEGKAAV